jgi:predicted component of type VI protein secretion system
VTPDETAERAALLAKSQRYEKALRQIVATLSIATATIAEFEARRMAREALAAAQEGDRK